jgi:hypothetical protein
VSNDNKIESVTFDSKYLTIHISYFIHQHPIFNHHSISNQSTHRIINILSNHWIQLSTHPIICQLIPSYHPIFLSINPSNQSIQSIKTQSSTYHITLYSNQLIHPIIDPNHWSIKSFVSDDYNIDLVTIDFRYLTIHIFQVL